MKLLRKVLNNVEHHFEKDGRLGVLYPLYEAFDSFLYTPADVTKGATHVRDSMDLKRMMTIVVLAVMPCVLFGMYNTGLQIANATSSMGGVMIPAGWRFELLTLLGLELAPSNVVSNIVLGALFFIPIYLVTNIVGGIWEVLFSIVRKHEINEGFFVTGFLFPLIVPASIPLWQVALGISFGVVIGKEIFGGTGRNFLNPALTARAFLFFAYPGEISGEAVWVALDGFTGATALAEAYVAGVGGITVSWWDAFLGFIPGSFGETSTALCLLGAIVLIYTGVGSWRIMLGVLLGMVAFSGLLNFIGSGANQMFTLTPMWHLVLGGFAFGTVFMATDPVSASMTLKGEHVYGLLIGFMVVLIRVINPAFPEGMMLAILFANMFAPLIDFFVVEANVKRRRLRNAKG